MQQEREKIYLTDGEGPVVFKDLARDISLKKLPQNQFDITSLWVAHDTEKQAPTFNPGDTLSLIVPHLVAHKVTDEDLREESASAALANGIIEHLNRLSQEGWKIGIVSTAYNHLWDVCGPSLGVDNLGIASTRLSLRDLKNHLIQGPIINAVLKAERDMEEHKRAITTALLDYKKGVMIEAIFQEPDMRPVDEILSELYFSRLPQLGYYATSVTEVMGGANKVKCLQRTVECLGADVSDVVYVGDSITDDRVLKFAREGGGLSIAVNGDWFAIRNANVALGTKNMLAIKTIIDAWESTGIEGVIKLEEGSQKGGLERNFAPERSQFSVRVVSKDAIGKTVQEHQHYRQEIRDAAIPLI